MLGFLLAVVEKTEKKYYKKFENIQVKLYAAVIYSPDPHESKIYYFQASNNNTYRYIQLNNTVVNVTFCHNMKHKICEKITEIYIKNIYKILPLCYSEHISIFGGGTMKTSSKERTLQWISNQYNKGNISFSHKLQRPIGQWSPKMKSLLIHSLLSGFPVNPIYCVEEDGTIYTLDGSQRTSTCISYVNNEFALSKDTPNIILQSKENGESIIKEYEIAGKKFKKLDPDVQVNLLACSLEFCMLSDYTDNEVREMFRRQNAGKPLNGKLLRVVNESDEFSDMVYSLATHPFMDKLMTKTQHKNGTDKDLIIQTLMLIETNQEHEFVSFRSKDIDSFVSDYSDSIETSKIDTLKSAMDKFNEAFEEITIPVTSIPMILYSGYRITKDKKSFSKLVDLVNDFLNDYDNNEEYKQYVQSGTSSSENVRGRLDWWRDRIRNI